MPLYEYECRLNRHTFEVRQPITSDPIADCPICGSPVRRVIHPVGIVFKGSGFYATDSRGKGVTSSHKPSESGGDGKSETKAESATSSSQSSASGSDAGGSKETSAGKKEAPAAAKSSEGSARGKSADKS